MWLRELLDRYGAPKEKWTNIIGLIRLQPRLCLGWRRLESDGSWDTTSKPNIEGCFGGKSGQVEMIVKCIRNGMFRPDASRSDRSSKRRASQSS